MRSRALRWFSVQRKHRTTNHESCLGVSLDIKQSWMHRLLLLLFLMLDYIVSPPDIQRTPVDEPESRISRDISHVRHILHISIEGGASKNVSCILGPESFPPISRIWSDRFLRTSSAIGLLKFVPTQLAFTLGFDTLTSTFHG